MPGKDLTRWAEGDDGSWYRINPHAKEELKQEVVEEIDIEVVEEEPEDEEPNATAGALEAAEELGVDLATVTGTGAEGRITKADVEAAAP